MCESQRANATKKDSVTQTGTENTEQIFCEKNAILWRVQKNRKFQCFAPISAARIAEGYTRNPA